MFLTNIWCGLVLDQSSMSSAFHLSRYFDGAEDRPRTPHYDMVGELFHINHESTISSSLDF